jgi:hypothetical protein
MPEKILTKQDDYWGLHNSKIYPQKNNVLLLTWVLLQVGLDGRTISNKSLFKFSSGRTNNSKLWLLSSTNNFNQRRFQVDGMLFPHLQSNTCSLAATVDNINE